MNEIQNATEQDGKGFFGILTGRESIKFNVAINTGSVAILCGGVFIVGLILVIISKKIH